MLAESRLDGRGHRVPRATSTHIADLVAAVAAGDAAGGATRLWATAATLGTPLVEPLGDDDSDGFVAVTFLWRAAAGTTPPLVLANKLHDRSDPDGSAMDHVPGTDVWHLTYRLPADWRGSYVIDADGHRPDPLCHATIGVDAQVRSLAELPDAPAQPYLAPCPGVPRGTVSEHTVAGRRVWRYLPPVASDRPLPLLVILDGDLWSGELGLATTLDNLIADGVVPPVAAAMVACGEGPARTTLLSDPAFAEWLAGDLLDELRAAWPVSPEPTATAVAGQSMGGLAAVRTAVGHPGRVANLVSHSASMWFPAEPPVAPATRLAELRAWVEVGTDEWINLDPNRALAAALADAGAHVWPREYHGGHDRACWRGAIAEALIAVFGDGLSRGG